MWNVFDIQRLIDQEDLPNEVSVDMEYKYKSVNIFKTKHFLKINRTNRNERDIFLLFLNFEKLLDKCLVSFPELHKWPEYPEMFYKYIQKENINDLKTKLPFDIRVTRDKYEHYVNTDGHPTLDAHSKIADDIINFINKTSVL